MKGYFSRYLCIDLTKEKIEEYSVPKEWLRKHLGGRGIGARILLEELDPDVEPLGPENILLFGTGPFQGTGIAGAGRHIVMAKSLKTNSVSGSYAGGFFAHELGTSGYDGILAMGKAETPKYITLIEGEAQIRDAEDLWGKDTLKAENILRERHENSRVCSIGPAGEKLVNFACIINDQGRATGRPGFGAVMGSKNLKAVVVKGGVDKDVYDEEALKKAKVEFARSLMDEFTQTFGEYGTPLSIDGLNELGILPTRNFQEGVFDKANKINAEALKKEILAGRDTCAGCPIRCKRIVRAEFNGEEIAGHGPEYETIAAFGSLCLNDNLRAIALANHKCTLYGMDTISVGNIIAFVMEATERGLMKTDLNWGKAKEIVNTVDLIGKKEGLGKELAKGLDYLKDELNADFGMLIKGQEIPIHDPRGKKGFGLDYATSPRGGTHLEGLHDTYLEVDSPAPELGIEKPMDRMEFEGKPRATKIWDDLTSFGNSLIMCRFTTTIRTGQKYNYDQVRKLLALVTGMRIDVNEMLKIGERNYVLLKIFSSLAGYTRKDDDLPPRLKEPLPNGASSGEPIPEKVLQEKIDEYYELRGFDKYGPTDKKLKELNLDELIGRIQRQD